MPITPTSTKSKQYQALGIDEIARDIETAFTAINAMPEAPTTTTVNISSAQILAMGSTPIELLPAAGVGKYYDIEKVIIEYTYISGTYGSIYPVFQQGDKTNYGLIGWDGTTFPLESCIFVINDTAIGSSSGYPTNSPILTNNPFRLTTNSGADPTGGVATLRAIITYTTRTFGA